MVTLEDKFRKGGGGYGQPFAATNTGQSISKANEKSHENNDFFDILSKNMSHLQMLQSQSPRGALKSIGLDIENPENAVRHSNESSRSMGRSGTDSRVADSKAKGIGSKGVRVQPGEEVSLSDEKEEQIESIILVVDDNSHATKSLMSMKQATYIPMKSA